MELLPCNSIVVRFIALLLLTQTVPICSGMEDDSNRRIPLHFLNFLPFPDSRPNAGWDRAYELLPAAELAAQHINNASGLLPKHTLNLVTIESEPCGISSVNNGLVYSYAEVFGEGGMSLNVVGMGGLFCSAVTQTIAGVFGSPNVTFLQLAGSNIPMHRNSSRFPWLVHFLSSTAVFNDAVLALMRAFHWQRISVVYSSSSFFYISDAFDFIKHAEDLGVEIVSTVALSDHQNQNEIFELLIEAGARIIHITAPNSQSAIVMCQAYKNRAVYPGYVYIFPETLVADIVASVDSTECTVAELLDAMEGVFFIKYNLVADEDAVLISNLSFTEYYQEYVSRVEEIESLRGISLDKANVYANVMYDQIWAFALALDASLEKINANNIDFSDLNFLESPFIADTLRSEIRGVSFQGASGYISFNSNNERESLVRVFQIISGREVLVGNYHGELNNTECLGNDVDLNTTLCLVNNRIRPPSDSFETTVLLLPLWVSILINTFICFFTVETTATLILLYVIFRKRPEVKASSVSLSMVIFIGCYFTYVSAFMRNVSRSYIINSFVVFTMICNMEIWFGSLGMTLVFSALFMRLLRVQRIFKAYGKVHRFWSDKYLILCVLAICLGNAIILSVWAGVDTSKRFTMTRYKSTSLPPHFESLSVCSSVYTWIWLLLISCYIGILMSLIVVMAVQTRKIKLSNFKDTKKINIFITATCTTLVTVVPVWLVLNLALEEFIAGHIFATFALICTGVYCQLFLFLPLVVKVVKKVRIERKSPKPTTADILKKKERQYSKKI